MLQYILSDNTNYSVGELAQMAIEGGCQWICIHLPEADDSEIRESVEPDVIQLCRESGVFLTIDDRPTLSRDLGLHGVRLSRRFFLDNPDNTPLSVREDLGPEAIIGIELTDLSALPQLIQADIDFATIRMKDSIEDMVGFIYKLRQINKTFPIVAEGDFDTEQVAALIEKGYSGVAIGRPISNAKDPVEAIARFINATIAQQ